MSFKLTHSTLRRRAAMLFGAATIATMGLAGGMASTASAEVNSYRYETAVNFGPELSITDIGEGYVTIKNVGNFETGEEVGGGPEGLGGSFTVAVAQGNEVLGKWRIGSLKPGESVTLNAPEIQHDGYSCSGKHLVVDWFEEVAPRDADNYAPLASCIG